MILTIFIAVASLVVGFFIGKYYTVITSSLIDDLADFRSDVLMELANIRAEYTKEYKALADKYIASVKEVKTDASSAVKNTDSPVK